IQPHGQAAGHHGREHQAKLGLNSAAYQIEYFRGAILSIGPGQMMAARALGMSQFKAIRVILMPQVFRIVLPTWANEAIS
ncbi:hypothetical protein NE579_16375, partial [Intestinimonas massiliensis]|nr:hypothetical protein [Intestinimonas massiliensis (ex Afouda et al. 2020)]